MESQVKETVFSYGHFMFPTPANGIVDTKRFLKAAEGMKHFMDLFCDGVISHVALINLRINLQRVSSAYNNNPKRYATINQMVEKELEDGEDAVIDALLWTKRCLHLAQLGMEYLVSDFKRGDFDGDVLLYLKRAYNNALYKYHNILTSTSATTAMSSLSAPEKREVILKLCLNVPGRETALIRDMDLAAESMKSTIRAIDQIYRTNGVNLETTERCIIL